MDNALEKRIKDLESAVNLLKTKRIYQQDIVPNVVKSRHMGEPNAYIFTGLAANRPTTGVKLTGTGFGCSIYWAYDTHVLSIWDGTIWRTVTLS